MSKSSVAWLVLGTLCACGGSSSPKSPDAAVDAPPDVPTRTVTGHQIGHFLTPTGQTDVPSDLSRAVVEVLVPPMFTPVVGTGSSDGSFTIPDVPVGEVYFVAGTHYFVITADTLDLDFYFEGRPTDGIATSPTNLTLSLTGMQPWQTNDEIEMYAPSAGTLAFGMTGDATSGAPAVNDTSLNGMVYDLRHADSRALLSASAGDTATIAQLSTTTDGTRSFTALSGTYAPAPFDLTNGGTATVTGAFTAVPASQTLTATWDRPAFAADLAAHFPHAATDNFSSFALTALPGATTHGFYTDGPDLLYFAPGYATDTSTVTAAWPYGDPFPADWGRIVWNRYYRYRFISLPGAQQTAIFAKLLTYRDASTLAADPMFEPGVGVVVNPTINGMDALGTANLTGVGTSPMLAWSAPAIGTPTKYFVTIYKVVNSGGQTTLQATARIDTPDTQLTIPPSLLVTGQPYVFDIGARATTVDLVAKPYQYALPDATSSVMTTMATP